MSEMNATIRLRRVKQVVEGQVGRLYVTLERLAGEVRAASVVPGPVRGDAISPGAEAGAVVVAADDQHPHRSPSQL